MKKFIQQPFRKRALQWEKFNADNFSDSKYVSQIRDIVVIGNPKLIFKIEDFDNIIYVPFEKTRFPVPSGYDDILTAAYGDWHKPKIFNTPVSDYSMDIPYSEYSNKSGFMNN